MFVTSLRALRATITGRCFLCDEWFSAPLTNSLYFHISYIIFSVVLQGITFRFIDTAGIRETHDAIENMGIERTFQKLDQAHIVIWLIDATGSTQDIEKIAGRVLPHCTDKRLIVAFNKVDKIESATQQQLTDLYKRLTREKPNTSFIFLSA